MSVLQSDSKSEVRETQAAVTREFLRRAGTYPIFRYEPTICNQLKFHLSKAKERWAFAGNKVGKSEMGAAEGAMIQLHLHPVHRREGPQKGLVVSTDFGASETIAQSKFFKFLPLNSPDVRNWNSTKHTLYMKDGGWVHFASADSDPLHFEGTDYDWVWLDEETPRKIYIAIKRGLVARGGILWATLTPVLGLTWTYREIQKGNEGEREIFSGEGWSIYDNPYLRPEDITSFEASLSEAEKAIRLYGRWTPLAGRPVFDLEAIVELLKKTRDSERAVLTVDEKNKVDIAPNPEGPLKIWKRPQHLHRYIIFADCAEGDSPDGAFQAAAVLDRDAFEIPTIYHCREKPREYGKNLKLLGRIHNNALLAIEMNPGGSGSVVLEAARDYRNLYYRQVYDEKTRLWTKKVGWRTTSANRHLLIAGCHRALKDNLGIYSEEIAEDFSNFIYKEGGGQEAQPGAFDDLVVAVGGAMQLHSERALSSLKEVTAEYAEAQKQKPFETYKPFPKRKLAGPPGWLVT